MSVLVIVFCGGAAEDGGHQQARPAALLVARPLSFIVALFGPLTLAIEAFVAACLRLFGVDIDANQADAVGARGAARRGRPPAPEGGVRDRGREMFGGLLDLDDLEVADVMIHRTKMATIIADQPPADIVKEVLASPYTRLPLWRGTPENIVGVLHAKDLLRALRRGRRATPAKLDVRAIALDRGSCPNTTSLADQLKAFRQPQDATSRWWSTNTAR